MSRTSFEPDFKVTVTTPEAEEPVIHVSGELDSGTSEELLDTFRTVLNAGRARTITLDMSQVSFIDSAGTRSVIMLEREAGEQGVALAIAEPAQEVTELLRTAGVIEHFQLRPGSPATSLGGSDLLERIELELPSDAESPARARVEVRELMAGREQTQIGDVVLLTSEVITNAVVHPAVAPGTRVGLRIFTYEE
ncbi:MAG: STAS domain-containing protein, partial [Solirubrobacterales bacterium]|nr:STAS domain-containing protein [Solirubrobacterales bacterium]